MRIHKALPHTYLIAASVIIPVLLFACMMWQDYRSILTETRNDAIRTANIYQQHALNVFETHQLVAERINDRLAGMSWDTIARSDEIRSYLKVINNKYPQVEAIWLADASGTVRAASRDLPATPISVADRDYFQELLSTNRELAIGKIVKPRLIESLNFNVALRRGSNSEAFNGVIIVTALPEYFSRFWNKASPMQSTATVMIRKDGALLARSLGINPDHLFLPLDSEPMIGIKSADRGSYVAKSVHDQTKRIFAFQKLDKYDVYLIHGVSMQSIIQEWQQHLLKYGVFFGIAISILMLLAIAVNKHATREQKAKDELRQKIIELDSARTDAEEAENALREGEERLRFHLDNSPLAVIEWDSSFNIVRWTGASEEIFGWSAAETVGKPLADLNMVFEDDIPILTDTIARLTDGKSRQVVSTNRNYTKNGEVRHCTWYNSVLNDQEGRLRSVLSKVIDITELRHAEQELRNAHNVLELRVKERTESLAETVENLLLEISNREIAEKNLQRLNSLYEVLSETNQTIVRATDRDFLFSEFCRIAVKRGGFLLSWVGLVDRDTGQIELVASYGATDYLEEIRISKNNEASGLGPTGIAVREGTYFICNDFLNDPCTQPWYERGKVHGIHASASIALREGGKVIGALTLYAGEKDFFDQQHVDLLQQMGEDVSFALDFFAGEELRRNTERALREETLERLQAVEELRKQEHVLIQQNRFAAMGEMIGNIAHQWRQPLNTLGLFTQRLGFFYGSPSFDKEFLDTSVAKSMEIIHYMSRTIDDFRNFFSTERVKTEFLVEDAVDKALSLVEASFKERKISIIREENKGLIINGYPNEFAQVLLNIFINAKDALIERNVELPHLKIVTGHENGTSVITIADNAGGIPDEVIDKIFDPYFTTKGPQQGTGVGLFMSKTIIENNMGGQLTVCNTDEGAEFRIEV